MLVPLCAALCLALAAPAKGVAGAAPVRHAAHKAISTAPRNGAAPRAKPSGPKAAPSRHATEGRRVAGAARGGVRGRSPKQGAPPHAPKRLAPPHAPRPPGAMRLDRARALLAAVKRDPAKRRYRHHWERAIAALQAAARGKDRGPALLEAARARYALYRFSQVEADRDAALALAARARRAGERQASAFTAAVRAEMGDDEPAPPQPPRPKTGPAERLAAKAKPASPGKSAPVAAAPRPARPAPPEEEPEPSLDPALQEALGDEVEEAAPAPLPAGPAHVSELRTWSNAGYTRVAIYLSHAVEFSKGELPAEDGERRRLTLDLAGAVLAKGVTREVGDAQVARVRAAQRGDGVRVVVDLAGEEAVSVVALQDPPRILVDVGAAAPPAGAEPPVARAEPAPRAPERPEAAEAGPAPEPRAEPRKPDPPRVATRSGPVRRVIVDAGHGGHDTGAIGPTGVREKEVTLAMARKLADALRGRGFEVVLTRSDDRFVPLEERAAIANARRGDLFISLHANAHPRRDQRGVESWVLNVADGRYAKRLAARENGALRDDAEGASDVRRVLTDLDAQASAGASRKVAELVQEQVCANIRARYGEVRDLGVKSALFYVLVGARMPAVLVETSFISNRVEERRLASGVFQRSVAEGVARAVEAYARRQERLAAR